jgi:hypothetical protein
VLVPQFAIQQSEDCQSLFFKDTTCLYDAVTCPCGYSPDLPSSDLVNPSKNDITKTVITITEPDGTVITLAKGYLPMQVSSLQIFCADLAISSVASVVTTPPDDCGCGSVQVITTTTVPATCFSDGCWTFKYDVYTNQPVVTYFWNLVTPSSEMFTYPAYCVTIIIDGAAVTNSVAIADEAGLLAWLNTLDSGYFTVAASIISVSSSSHTYGALSFSVGQKSFNLSWSPACGFVFPVTFTSVAINGIVHTINQSASSWNDIITLINNLGLGTFANGGGNPGAGTQVITQTSCGTSVLSNFVFANTCTVATSPVTPTTHTINPTSESVDMEVIVGSSTHQEFLYCNVKNAIKQFKLSNLQKDCACGDTKLCELDSDYSTMIIAATGSGNCSCACAKNYLVKVQSDLSVLQKLCQ